MLGVKHNFLRAVVEGNIGAGKSSLLNKIEENFCPVDTLVSREPVEEWQNWKNPIDGKDHNLLQYFYEDMGKRAETFEHFAAVSMVRYAESAVENVKREQKKYFIQERSAFSTVKIFAPSQLNEVQLGVLVESVRGLTSGCPDAHEKDMVIYIRTPPDVCFGRIQRRSREEESDLKLNYLEKLHERYETWLYNRFEEYGPKMVLVLNGRKSINDLLKDFERAVHYFDVKREESATIVLRL